MVSENNFLTASGTIIPDETLQGAATFSKVMLCGASGTSIIPLTCDSDGRLLMVYAGSVAGI